MSQPVRERILQAFINKHHDDDERECSKCEGFCCVCELCICCTRVDLQEATDALLALFDELAREAIGEDEKGLPIDDIYRTEAELHAYYRDRTTRDKLRAEQRQRLSQFKSEAIESKEGVRDDES